MKGWSIVGPAPDDYSAELTDEAYDGKPIVRISRVAHSDDAFGSLGQRFDAAAYRGKRVRLSATVRAVNLDWAALHIRVHGFDGPITGDGSNRRVPVSGTTAWMRVSCVVDIRMDATAIFVALLVYGDGDLYVADVRFEIVGHSIASTAMASGPMNLDLAGPPRTPDDPFYGRASYGWAEVFPAHAYAAELATEQFEGKPVVLMRRLGGSSREIGGMFQVFDAHAYRGKRMRFSAALRTVGVNHAFLCFRVDAPDREERGGALAFDNMWGRAVGGTTDWARHSCVLDVAPQAAQIFISVLVAGDALYASDFRFEVVDESVPVTDMRGSVIAAEQRQAAARPYESTGPFAPVNLDFTEP